MKSREVDPVLLVVVACALALPFLGFFKSLGHEWVTDLSFSHGMVIPLISAFILWQLRSKLTALKARPWNPGLALTLVGCALQVMGTLSGVLLVSGLALILVLIGVTAFFWGKAVVREVSLPIVFLIFMAPLPSYALGSLSWRLQIASSTTSARLLRLFNVPVLQDGNLLILPNYALSVEEVCSGTRSLFALLALAAALGLLAERSWVIRVALIAAAPLMALMANVIRIVATSVAVHWFGHVATDEALHSIWGVLVFLIAVAVLLATQRLFRWLSYRFAPAS